MMFENLDCAFKLTLDGENALRGKIAELRNEVSELKGALIEARHEVRELKLIQESLRISTRGEPGRDGARGVPGRDGRDATGVGPCGEKGDRGEAAPRLATWSVDAERFTVMPVFGDGTSGAALSLLELFQAYDRAVSWREEADLVTDAADAPEAAKREVEASCWAK
jgi:hypothetical protein